MHPIVPGLQKRLRCLQMAADNSQEQGGRVVARPIHAVAYLEVRIASRRHKHADDFCPALNSGTACQKRWRYSVRETV